MNDIKALLFDFDGVLADTERFHWRAWLEVLTPYSPELDWATYERLCIGISDVEMRFTFSQLCGKSVTPDEIRDLYPQKRKVFQALTDHETLVDEQVVRLLASLPDVDLAVVTSSNQAEVEPILRHAMLLGSLNTVVYGNQVTHYKPNPEPYLLALERLGVEAHQAVVFEDSAAGIRSGKDAGCRVVEVKAPKDLPGLIEDVLFDGFNF